MSAQERSTSPTWQWIFTTALVVIGMIVGFYAKSLGSVHDGMTEINTSVNQLRGEVVSNQATIEIIARSAEETANLSREVGEALTLMISYRETLADHEARLRAIERRNGAR